jgi:uncharacterized protein involved in outer membrane biogenesis
VPPFVDWSNYRADFEREASRILGQEVRVNGSADARLLPFPSVTFNDVEVGAQEGAEPMMRIARFSMDAELAPFLSGEIRIIDMRIEEPRANVELAADGTLDWANRREGDLRGGTLVLERVAISDGTVTINDVQNGRSHRIDALNSVVSAQSLAGPWRMEGTASIDGETGAFSVSTGALTEGGGVRLRSRLLPDRHPVSIELEGTATIADNKPRYQGGFTLQALDIEDDADAVGRVALRGTGLFDADNERLRIGEYRLEVGALADPYIVTGEATIDTGETPEFLLIADGQQINVDQLQENAQGAGGDDESEPRPLSAAERIETFRRIVERIPIPDLPGRVSLVLPAIIAGETTLREVSIDAQPARGSWQVDRFSAALPGRTQIEASGRLRLGDDFGFGGHLVLASNQPSGFAAWLTEEVHPAIRALTAAGFEADVDLSERLQRFEKLEMAVGTATLRGRFERIAGDTPALSMDIAGDAVDLDAVNALVQLFTGGIGEDRVAAHDIAARLRADRFTAGGIDMNAVDTAFTLRDGLLSVDRLAIGDLAGAAIDGRGVFSDVLTEPQGQARLSLAAANPAAFLALVSRHASQTFDLSRLRGNSGLFGDTDLTIDLQFGSARDSGVPGRTSGYDIHLAGTTGGSEVDIAIASDASLIDGFDVPLSARLSASNPRADILLAQMGVPVLPFDIGHPAELTAEFDGKLAEGADVSLEIGNEDTHLSLDGAMALVDRRVRDGRFGLTFRSNDAEPYLMLAGIGLPGFGAGLPAALDADIEVGGEKIVLSGLNGEIAQNAFDGTLSVTREAQPAIAGDIALDTFDAGWLAEAIWGQPLASPDGAGWSATEFPTAMRTPAKLDVALAASRAYLGYAEAADTLSARLSMTEGSVSLSDASANWLGGRLEGSLTVANTEGAATAQLQMRLAEAFVARALAGIEGDAPASGLADLSLSLEASGRNPAALVQSLTGSGALTISDLRLTGLDGGAFPEIVAAADAEGFEITEESVRAVAGDALADGVVPVDRVSVPVTIAGGVLRASNVVLANPDLEARGNVQMNLAEATLNAGFEIAFEAGDETLPGATPALRLGLQGPVAGPALQINATEMANFLSLRAYERERRRVERVQAAVLEKQRLRRETAYLRAVMREREEARLTREAAEAERREREVRRQEEERERLEEEEAAAEQEPPPGEDVTAEPGSLPEPAEPDGVPLPSEAPQDAPTSTVPDDTAAPPFAPLEGWSDTDPAVVPPSGPLPRLNFEELPGVQVQP